MNGARRLRVACVGAGHFSRFHRDSWQRIERVDLIGVVDADVAKAEETGFPAFSDLAALCNEVAPDILDIIVPPTSQAAVLTEAFAQRIPTIICQKPFARNREEAGDLVKTAADSGSRLIIHENFRFQPWFRAAKEALDQGLLGEVMQATFRLRPGDGQGPDAYMDRQPYFQTLDRFLIRETVLHYVDTFQYLFGAATQVYADLRKLNPAIAGEDAGIVALDHASGVRTLIDGNRHLDHATDNLRRTMGEGLIEGTQGSLTIDGTGALRLRKFGQQQPTVLYAGSSSDQFGGDCVHALQSHVANALLKDGAIENEAQAYLPLLDIEAAIYASAELGSKISLTSG